MAPSESLRLEVARGAKLALREDVYWRLERGDVVVYRAGRPIELWRAPCWLDVSGTLHQHRATSFAAASDVVVTGISRSQLRGDELVAALADENALLWHRVEADARRDDDSFLPYAVPVPGPWHFRGAKLIALVMQGDARRLGATLPRGVRLLPGTGGRYVIGLAQFDGAGSLDERDLSQFAYREVTPFVPVWSGARMPAAFIPELYPDAWMATILGREIHGFPKRTARVGFHADGGELLVDRRLALRVRFANRTAVAPAEAFATLTRALSGSKLVAAAAGAFASAGTELGFDVLVHKRIGEPATAGRTFAIDDVMRVGFRLDAITSAAVLHDLTVEVAAGGLLHGHVLGGIYLETGMRFGPGRLERPLGTRRGSL